MAPRSHFNRLLQLRKPLLQLLSPPLLALQALGPRRLILLPDVIDPHRGSHGNIRSRIGQNRPYEPMGRRLNRSDSFPVRGPGGRISCAAVLWAD